MDLSAIWVACLIWPSASRRYILQILCLLVSTTIRCIGRFLCLHNQAYYEGSHHFIRSDASECVTVRCQSSHLVPRSRRRSKQWLLYSKLVQSTSYYCAQCTFWTPRISTSRIECSLSMQIRYERPLQTMLRTHWLSLHSIAVGNVLRTAGSYR